MADISFIKKTKNMFHEEEKDIPKVYLIAQAKLNNSDPKWWIRKDRLNRCRILEAIYHDRPDGWILDLTDEKVCQFLPRINDLRELYHLMNWINRDQLVIGEWVISLNRLLQMAKEWEIVNHDIINVLKTIQEKCYEIHDVGHGIVLSMYTSEKEAELEFNKQTEQIKKQDKHYNPLKLVKRNDDLPFDSKKVSHIQCLQPAEYSRRQNSHFEDVLLSKITKGQSSIDIIGGGCSIRVYEASEAYSEYVRANCDFPL